MVTEYPIVLSLWKKGENDLLIITIFAVILIFCAYGLHMIKNKLWRELSVFGFLIGISLFLAIVNALDMKGPIALMDDFLSPYGKAIFK
ncbi:MAG TPA: hypothetical protein DEP72_02385 [Clostridiales bacterium]|nr:MAG: hypothetical protein A2Y18_01320 [Clostridiales bacterium GWD2_32_19]HCC07004.1 hypothetical protein [Clostridiales bacterium]